MHKFSFAKMKAEGVNVYACKKKEIVISTVLTFGKVKHFHIFLELKNTPFLLLYWKVMCFYLQGYAITQWHFCAREVLICVCSSHAMLVVVATLTTNCVISRDGIVTVCQKDCRWKLFICCFHVIFALFVKFGK